MYNNGFAPPVIHCANTGVESINGQIKMYVNFIFILKLFCNFFFFFYRFGLHNLN